MALIFGFVTMLSGVVGVPLGSILSTKLKQKYARADPLICAGGLILSALLLGVAMVICNKNIYLAFFLLFLGEVALNLNWSIVADILLVSFVAAVVLQKKQNVGFLSANSHPRRYFVT